MNRKHPQTTDPIEVILMLGDGALSTGVENLLFKKKNLRIHRIAECNNEDSIAELGQKKKTVVVVSTFYSHHSSKCLIGLLSNPQVEEIFMIDVDNNMVQVLKKRQVMLTDKKDFAKLFNRFNPKGEVPL